MSSPKLGIEEILEIKNVMQKKLFQKCTHLLYCSVLSLGGNVNTRRMSKPDMGSIFHIKKSMKYSGLRSLFLFTNSTHRELVSICAQSVCNSNKLSLHYNPEREETAKTSSTTRSSDVKYNGRELKDSKPWTEFNSNRWCFRVL